MKSMKLAMFASVAGAALIGSAYAQSGPVARSCSADISKLCANRPHDGSTRICLERAYDKLSTACKSALDSTGGGRGKGLGKGKGMAKGKTG